MRRVLSRNYGNPITKEAYSTEDMGGAGQMPQSVDQRGKKGKKKCGHKGKCACPIEMPSKVGKPRG